MLSILLTALVGTVQAGPVSEVLPGVSPGSAETTQAKDGTSSLVSSITGAGRIFVLTDGSVVVEWEEVHESTDQSSPPAHIFILPGDEEFTLVKDGSEWHLERSNAVRQPDVVPSSALRIPLGSNDGDTLRSVLEMEGTLTLTVSDESGVRALRLEESSGPEVFSISFNPNESGTPALQKSGAGRCCEVECSGLFGNRSSCSCSVAPCNCFCSLAGARCDCGGEAYRIQ